SHLKQTLQKLLHLHQITLIPTPNPHIIHPPPQQSNHPSNTLSIPPPLLLTYHPNYLSNQFLPHHPIKLIQIPPTQLLPRPPPPPSITQ
uniref:arginine deiminase family protein n=1 Tax=Staphylococcus epidermidis TaxID=1282 RepID=UPI0037D9EC93